MYNGKLSHGAILAATIITRKAWKSKKCIKTMFGDKTTKGIADLIERQTGTKELLDCLMLVLAGYKFEMGSHFSSADQKDIDKADAAIRKYGSNSPR